MTEQIKEIKSEEVITQVDTTQVPMIKDAKIEKHSKFDDMKRNFRTGIIDGIVMPAIKNTLYTAIVTTVSNMANILINGQVGSQSVSRPAQNNIYSGTPSWAQQQNQIRYSSIYGATGQYYGQPQYAGFKFDNITYGSYEFASSVLNAVYEAVAKYGRYTVAELYSESGITVSTTDYPMYNYGWVQLPMGIQITPVMIGGEQRWKINLPQPVVVK